MRAATAPLQAYYHCPMCQGDHAAVIRVQGLPILRCAQVKGTAVHFLVDPKGLPLLVTGEVGSETAQRR